VIIANHPKRTLWIDSAIEGYEIVKQILATWRPIEIKRPALTFWFLTTLVAVMLSLALSMVAYECQTLAWFLPTGVPMMGVLVWFLIAVRRSPQYDQKTRRAAWIAVIPLLALGFKLIALIRHTQ
jgi:hypothetical protein